MASLLFDPNNPKRSRLVTYDVVAILFVIGFFILQNTKGSNPNDFVTFSNDGYFSVLDANGIDHRISYADVTNLTYVDTPVDLGEPINGGTEKKFRSGLWHCDAYGDYYALLSEKVGTYFVVETAEETFVINFESEENTEALFKAFQKAVEEAK